MDSGHRVLNVGKKPFSGLGYHFHRISFAIRRKEKNSEIRWSESTRNWTTPSPETYSSSFSRRCDDEIYTVESEHIQIPTSESVPISRIASSPLRHSSSRPPLSISLFFQGTLPYILIRSVTIVELIIYLMFNIFQCSSMYQDMDVEAASS